MALKSRWRPVLLPEKLLRIRKALGLSQGGILKQLGLEGGYHRQHISHFETGKLEPPLPVLLLYARIAGISTDVLIDDAQQLPANLPVPRKRRSAH